jgi:hypothetical protein
MPLLSVKMSALQVPMISVRWLCVLAALGRWAWAEPALGATLRVQVKVTAAFSGIPREQIRAAKVSAAPSEKAGVAVSLKDFDYTSCLAGALVERLKESGRFDQVTLLEPGAKGDADPGPLILVEVSKWGFRYSPADPKKGSERKGQLEHLVRYTMSGPERRTSSRELFLSGKERLLQEYRDDEAFLVSELRNSIQTYAGLLVNKVLYPK